MNFEAFKNIQPKKKRTKCSVCLSNLSSPAIELKRFPVTEILVNEKPDTGLGLVDQGFHFCENCGHGQLSSIIDSKILYEHSYSFRTSGNVGSVRGNDLFVDFVEQAMGGRHFETIVEIGSSDLYLLKKFKKCAKKLVAIDPILKNGENVSQDSDILIIGDYVENIDLGKLIGSGNTLIINSHNIEHIEEPRTLINELLKYATDETLFVFQFPCLDTIVEEGNYFQIFHHHLHYFSLQSFKYLLNDLNAQLIDFKTNRDHWGSLLVSFKKGKMGYTIGSNISNTIDTEVIKKGYSLFRDSMSLSNEYIKASRFPLYAYGAILTMPVLAYHLQNDLSDFVALIDEDINKQGLFYLNLSIPIVHLSQLEKEELQNMSVVVSAIKFSRVILPKLIELRPRSIILLTHCI